jgi:hypothetical protein
MTVALQYEIGTPGYSLVGLGKEIIHTQTAGTVSLHTLEACRDLGAKLTMSQKTSERMDDLAHIGHTSPALNCVKSYFGWATGDTAFQLAQSSEGLNFLGLASVLVSSCRGNDPDDSDIHEAASTLNNLIRLSAPRASHNTPTVPQLRALLGVLKDRLRHAAFASKAVEWGSFLLNEVVKVISNENPTKSLKTISHENLMLSAPCSYPPSDAKEYLDLLQGLFNVGRLGDVDSHLQIDLTTSEASFVIALAEWCLEEPPTVSYNNRILYSSQGSRAFINIRLSASNEPQRQISIYRRVDSLTELVQQSAWNSTYEGRNSATIDILSWIRARVNAFSSQFNINHEEAVSVLCGLICKVTDSIILDPTTKSIRSRPSIPLLDGLRCRVFPRAEEVVALLKKIFHSELSNSFPKADFNNSMNKFLTFDQLRSRQWRQGIRNGKSKLFKPFFVDLVLDTLIASLFIKGSNSNTYPLIHYTGHSFEKSSDTFTLLEEELKKIIPKLFSDSASSLQRPSSSVNEPAPNEWIRLPAPEAHEDLLKLLQPPTLYKKNSDIAMVSSCGQVSLPIRMEEYEITGYGALCWLVYPGVFTFEGQPYNGIYESQDEGFRPQTFDSFDSFFRDNLSPSNRSLSRLFDGSRSQPTNNLLFDVAVAGNWLKILLPGPKGERLTFEGLAYEGLEHLFILDKCLPECPEISSMEDIIEVCANEKDAIASLSTLESGNLLPKKIHILPVYGRHDLRLLASALISPRNTLKFLRKGEDRAKPCRSCCCSMAMEALDSNESYTRAIIIC